MRVFAQTWANNSLGNANSLVLEDNDPTGYKSQKGKDAKPAAGISILEFPMRSPDLSVCDHAIRLTKGSASRRARGLFYCGSDQCW